MTFRGSATLWLRRACICALACGSLSGQDDLREKAAHARQEMAEGRYREAAGLYADLVRELPQNAGLLLNLGLAQHSAGQYREAIASFSAALKLDPGLTNARFLTGMAYQKLGEPARAVSPLGDTVAAEPGNRIARWELGDALLATNRFDEAARQFEALTKVDPEDPRYWQGLGLSYAGLSRRSFATLEKADPESPYVDALLADSLYEQRQDRGAFGLYRKALAGGVEFQGIHAALADIYRRNGHADWAAVEEQRERSAPAPDCSLQPQECAFLHGEFAEVLGATNTPEHLYWKSRSYREMGRAALEHLAQLPPSPQMHELMADAFRIEGQHGEAAGEFRNALKLSPGSLRLRQMLAAELWRARDFGAAQPALEALLAASANSAEINYELGDLLLEKQDSERALPLLEKAVRLKPDLLPAQTDLARALVNCGRFDAAILHFQKALTADEDGQIHFELARAARRAGKAAIAQQAMQQFQTMTKARAVRRQAPADQDLTAPN